MTYTASRLKTALPIVLLLSLAVAGSAAAATTGQWIHVKIESQNDDERVTLNLPFSLLHAAVAMIPDDVRADGEIELHDIDMDWNDLMTLWSEVKNAPEATYVTVETKDEKIVVRKEGDFLVVKTSEHTENGAEVDARFPLAVIDALLSGPEGTFDFAAALNALADAGPGNLVSVRDGDETVRIWIDDQNNTD